MQDEAGFTPKELEGLSADFFIVPGGRREGEDPQARLYLNGDPRERFWRFDSVEAAKEEASWIAADLFGGDLVEVVWQDADDLGNIFSDTPGNRSAHEAVYGKEQ